MSLTQSQAENVLYVLTKRVKHRSTQPFTNELVRFAKSGTSDNYSFLSEDYHQYKLIAQPNSAVPFRLVVKSENSEVLAKVELANHDLADIFS